MRRNPRQENENMAPQIGQTFGVGFVVESVCVLGDGSAFTISSRELGLGRTEYVTHLWCDGSAFAGHYFGAREDAEHDMLKRVGECLRALGNKSRAVA